MNFSAVHSRQEFGMIFAQIRPPAWWMTSAQVIETDWAEMLQLGFRILKLFLL